MELKPHRFFLPPPPPPLPPLPPLPQGPILDKTHTYREFIKIGFCCGIGALIFMLVMLTPGNEVRRHEDTKTRKW